MPVTTSVLSPRETIQAKFTEALRLLGELMMQRDALDKQITQVRGDIEALDKVATLFPVPEPVGTLDPPSG